MQCLDTIAIRHSGTIRRVMLYHGDLSRIPDHEAVDLLVVSAYPNSYHPSHRYDAFVSYSSHNERK